MYTVPDKCRTTIPGTVLRGVDGLSLSQFIKIQQQQNIESLINLGRIFGRKLDIASAPGAAIQ